MNKEEMKQLLLRNADRPFVQRVLNPEAHPVRQNPDGSVSTHLMAQGEVDGKQYAYPTITVNREKGRKLSGGLKQRFKKDALIHALRTGNAIEFPTEKEAYNFTKNYKKVWND
tara:strand:+ start:6714 stop:7052 length:339 start_codon:yes stop_codon:yes gene_type:complete